MKRLMIAAAAVLMSACTPPAQDEAAAPELPAVTLPMADAAGNRMEALSEQNGRWCSGDGVWCVTRGESTVAISRGRIELLTFDESTGTPEVWPVIIREPNDASVVIGLGWTQSQMYSGGGGDATKVTLYRITQGSALIPEVGTWPSRANITIRACFDEDDQRARREACVDDYSFVGQLALDTENASGPPRLLLSTLATSYPGVRSRSSDSTTEAPLQESDLFIARDDTCSYQRAMVWDQESFAYDSEPPACTDYLEP